MNNFQENFYIFLIIVLFSTCSEDSSYNIKKDSIYDYTSDVILGDPIRISISEGENEIYKIESDTLLDSLGNILLIGGVDIDVFDYRGKKSNDIYSNRAIVYNRSDSMLAQGNVKIVSALTGYELYTERIILYNNTQLVRSKDEVLFINEDDSLRGIGFWSDFNMENWTIEKPIGSIIKGK